MWARHAWGSVCVRLSCRHSPQRSGKYPRWRHGVALHPVNLACIRLYEGGSPNHASDMEEPFMGCPAFHIVKCLLQALPWEGPRLAVAQQQQQQVGSRADRYLAGFGAVYVPKVCLMATATSFDGGARARSRAGGSGFDGGARRARISASSGSVPRGCGTALPARRKKQPGAG